MYSIDYDYSKYGFLILLLKLFLLIKLFEVGLKCIIQIIKKIYLFTKYPKARPREVNQ